MRDDDKSTLPIIFQATQRTMPMKHSINRLPMAIGLSLAMPLSFCQAMETQLQEKIAAAHQQFIKFQAERIAEKLGIQVAIPLQFVKSNQTAVAEESSDCDYFSLTGLNSPEEESVDYSNLHFESAFQSGFSSFESEEESSEDESERPSILKKLIELEKLEKLETDLQSLISEDGYIDVPHLKTFWTSPSKKFHTIKARGEMTDEQLYELVMLPTNLQVVNVGQCTGLSDAALKIWSIYANYAPSTLDLTDYKINDSIATILAKTLTYNTTITALTLHGNQIGNVGASKLAEALLINKTLTALNICQNNIGDEGAINLAKALFLNKSLVRLFLHRNQIGSVGATHLARSLHCNNTLKSLHLMQNNIGDEGAIEMGKALCVNNSITWLQIGHNQITDIAFEALKEGLIANQSLTVFNIEGNAMTESCKVPLQKLRIKGKRCIVMEGSKYLSQPFIQQQDNDDDYGRVFQTDEHLYDLVNSGAKPGDIEESQCEKLSDTARHIFSIFNNTAPTILGLSDHSDNNHAGMVLCPTDRIIDDRIATVLAKALTHNTTITDIDMRHNLIGDVGAAELMNVLRINTTLTSLVFYQNRIGDEGAAKISEILSQNTTLKWLFLNKNHITDVGAVKIANALATNTTLTTLNLNFNQIGEMGKAALLANRSPNLTALAIITQQQDLISEDGYCISDLRLFWTSPIDRGTILRVKGTMEDEQLYDLMTLPPQFKTWLKYVDLSQCTGLSYPAKLLCDLYFNVPLVKLHLETITMDDHMAAALGETLKRNSKSITLDLRYNGLTAIGAGHVGQGLAANTGLSSIILYEHHMGEDGTIEIAKSLLTNRTLRDFEIWGQISEGCATIYGEVLRINTALTRLSLYNSQVNNSRAIKLAKGLKGNTSLKVLSLHSNLIGDAGGSAIAEALVGNTTLSALNLGNNLLSDSMKETMKQNPSVNLEVIV